MLTAVYITSSCMRGVSTRSSSWLRIDRKAFKEKVVLRSCPLSLLAGECGYPVATGAIIFFIDTKLFGITVWAEEWHLSGHSANLQHEIGTVGGSSFMG